MSTLPEGDVLVIGITLAVYVVIVWVMMAISLFLVFTRDNDKETERAFDQMWYRWKIQHIWHELWFRMHIIVMCCLVVWTLSAHSAVDSVCWMLCGDNDGGGGGALYYDQVVFIYEGAIPWWLCLTIFFVVLFVTISLKYTSRRVGNRIPSDETKIELYKKSKLLNSNNQEAELAQEIELQQKGSEGNAAETTSH